MKCLIILLLLTAISPILNSQSLSMHEPVSEAKQPIDLASIENWPWVDKPIISNDGKYVSYVIEQQPVGRRTLFVAATDGSWKTNFAGVSTGFFSVDSKMFILSNTDTLCLLTLETRRQEEIPNVASIQSPGDNKGLWLTYQLQDKPYTLILRNLLTGKEQTFAEVADYFFDHTGNALVLQNSITNTLLWVNLSDSSIHTIWPTGNSKLSKLAFDKYGQQLAFMVPNFPEGNSIWYYKIGMEHAVELVNSKVPGIDSDMVISSLDLKFNQSGQYVMFRIQYPPDSQKPKADAVPVDVWHYNDKILQSAQLNGEKVKMDFAAAINVRGHKIIRLEFPGETLIASPDQINGNFAVVTDKQDTLWWKRSELQAYYIVSLEDGSRKLLKKGAVTNIRVSHKGKYLVYFDGKRESYISYELQTGISRNISKGITERLVDEYYLTLPDYNYKREVGIVGWLEQETSLLVYDNYDIWQLDAAGVHQPINITSGYGRRNHIKFRFVYPPDYTQSLEINNPLLLTAFNTMTKYNGFYQIHPEKKGDPIKLTMGPFLFYRVDTQVPNNGDAYDQGMKPLKATEANIWIVKRQTATEFPNYFLTTDFRGFKPLTNIQFQKNYNWLTTELITWKQLDGTLTQGILYKPENFNPQKKYPVIFSYYETFSFRMYEFPTPYFSIGRIDIPWYVSRGYLVVTPDIKYSIASVTGKLAGDAAINSIVSAARYLAKRPYVDANRVGIKGRSYGGGETLYLITHSNLFAAACAAAPTVSNEISAYLGIHTLKGKPGAEFRLSHAEVGHDRIGATLWQRPDLYIKASPVFKADEVTTPLLIMHNQGDVAVEWSQAVEMYMALRRLGKKVWMLQYDHDDHVLHGNNAIDFTIRMNQFFDYYLKGTAPPKWMTYGISASRKGIDDGLELDISGKKP